MQYVYCLFCETNKCKKVASLLEMKGIDRAFAPQIIKRQRKLGQNVDMRFDLLPGYVFVYSSRKSESVSALRVEGVIRVLGLPEDGFCLRGADLDFAMSLLNKDGILDVMHLIRVGDKVEILDPIFNRCKGSVLHLDYRKQRANIEFAFSGMIFHSWVACDILYPQTRS